ncbi:MAG TPA: cell wall-binding repeat-containing protein [Acidimicrobiales bacterium]|nr:cell wall-binding repeat-containing protein [Acidimicrobiales bacterium]
MALWFAELRADVLVVPGRIHLQRALLCLVTVFIVLAAAPLVRADAANPQWDEWDFLNLMNRERYQRGMQPLAMVPGVRDVSRGWSGVMAADGVLRHNPDFSGQIQSVLPNWMRAGENVGVGGDVAQLHTAFMNSPKHRDNVLGNFQWVGVGVRWAGSKLWVTVNFVTTTSPVGWQTRTPMARLVGASDSDTSVLMSRRLPPGSAAGVVVARSDQFADALAGGPLAAAHNGSVLLVPQSGVPANVISEAQRVLAPGGRVIILGGTGAMPVGIENSFRSNGLFTERIAGADRYGTATAVAPRVNSTPGSIFVVSGLAFPDAVAASAVGAARRSPIVLVAPGGVPTATGTYLAAHPAAPRIVVGGPAAVPEPVAVAVGSTQRVHGPDRYATAVNVANTFFPGASRVVVVSGGGFADALVSAPAAGRSGAPLVLTAPRPTDWSYGYLATQNKRWVEATVVGNTAALPDSAVQLLFS